MAQMINTNIASLNAQRNLTTSQNSLATSLQRLSSGLRINSAKDDAAGMAIANRMTSQINGLTQAARNANDGISLAQTAEGAMQAISDNLQRMRDLSVQAANASTTAPDRISINNEVQQLSEEIQRVASSTSFNGTKLVDGTFNAQTFQVGANRGDTININSIANMQTSQLGSAGSTYAASVTGTATTAALTAGDLTLNGFQVGASQLGAAPGQSAASAFSVAAAINTISPNSGVTATANVNTVAGAASTVFTAVAADTFSINGVNVGATVAGGDAAGQGANVAAAINLVSSQSGVTAAADAVTGALTLTAADGRDISIGLNGTAVDAATAAANKAAFLTQTGLNTANVGTQAVAGGGAVAAVNDVDLPFIFGTDSVTLNGVTFSVANPGIGNPDVYTVNNATSVTVAHDWMAGNDSTALFNAIVAAQANPLTSAALSTVTVSNTGTAVRITDVTPGVSTTTLAGSFFTNITNVVAGAAGGGPATAATNVENHGTVTLSSNSSTGIVLSGGAVASGGFTTGTTAASVTSTVSSVSALNVLTASAAANAITTIDGALATVDSARGSLGAYQNRFASAVSNLQVTTENLTASRSRILDTDFATETAALTRAQILQQAGTAMLAQANSVPNGVMALLR